MARTHKRKWCIVVFFVLFASLDSFGQLEKEITIFKRLLILNSNKELLVVKVENADTWVTPGFYQTKQTIKQGLDSIAATYGLKITMPELKGIFLLKRDINGELSTSLRNIYIVNTKDIEVKIPKGISEAKWLPIDKAMEQISFPHINAMIAQITSSPKKVWGGCLSQFKENGQWKTEIVQEFYIISETQCT